MGKRAAEAPWTWSEISALEGAALARFHRDYGERAKAARMVACYMARACGITGAASRVPCLTPWWGSDECPANRKRWRRRTDPRDCIDAAPLVYARMVAELGLLPE